MTDTELALIVEVRRLLRSGEARCRCKAAGVRDAEIACALGVSRSAVNRWQRGERIPRGAAALSFGRLLTKIAGDQTGPR